MKERIEKNWEPLVYRPELPEGWSVTLQNDSLISRETSFTRWGVIHHNQIEPQRLWVVFHEFNENHRSNRNNSYKYTVRGGRNIKPESKIKYFKRLEDAEKYLISLMNATDRWVKEITSPSYIDAYNKKIESAKR